MRLIAILSFTLMVLVPFESFATEAYLWEQAYQKSKKEDECRSLKNPKDNFKWVRLNRITVGMSECAMHLAAKVSGGTIDSTFEDKNGTVRVWKFPPCAFGRMDDHLGVDCYSETIVNTLNGVITSIFHED